MTNQHTSEELRERIAPILINLAYDNPYPSKEQFEQHLDALLALLQPKDATPTQTSASAAGNLRPEKCRQRLKDEGKPYPRTGCRIEGCGGALGGRICEKPTHRPDPAGLVAGSIERIERARIDLECAKEAAQAIPGLYADGEVEEAKASLFYQFEANWDTLKAALKAMTQTGGGWRPMSEAPKNHEWVWLTDGQKVLQARWTTDLYTNEWGWFDLTARTMSYFRKHEPIAWQPYVLPTPPQTEGDG